MLCREDIAKFVEDWLRAWNRHDLAGVLQSMADDVVFEHWNTRLTRGKTHLERLWRPWFAAHGDFRFDIKSLCVDAAEQTCTFEWLLDWPSPEHGYAGQREQREGVDVVVLRDGQIINKRSYTKTVLKIENRQIPLKA